VTSSITLGIPERADGHRGVPDVHSGDRRARLSEQGGLIATVGRSLPSVAGPCPPSEGGPRLE
jgi:hypothetical protein